MRPATLPAPAKMSRVAGKFPKWTATAAAGLLVLGAASRVMWPTWEINPEYQYGMFMPVLCAALLFLRWGDRPEPLAGQCGVVPAASVALAAAVCLALLQPLSESNPDWRLLCAIAAGAFAAWGLAAAYSAGGWPWLRHFAFPILFFLAAVPWPKPVEDAVTTTLKPFNAGVAVEALHWAGYPARQRGHIVELETCRIGVDEGCTGVRSLQGCLVAALFCGEIARMGAAGRLALCAFALGIAMLGNLIRTLILAFAAASRGTPAVQSLHDPAGIVILVVVALALRFCIQWIGCPGPGSPAQPGARGEFGRWWPVALITAIFLLGSLVGAQAWFVAHERNDRETVTWDLSQRSASGEARNLPVSEATAEILKFSRGFSETWSDEGGRRWLAYYFRWNPGRIGAQVTYGHTPEVCLGLTGLKLVARQPPVTFRREGLEIPLDAYEFSDNGRRLFVFHGILEDFRRGEGEVIKTGYDARGRLRAAWEGRRNRGQRLVEYAVWNAADYGDAREALLRNLDRDVKMGGTP